MHCGSVKDSLSCFHGRRQYTDTPRLGSRPKIKERNKEKIHWSPALP